MPAYRRSEIVTDHEISSYHCISRCVRRAFLCGRDSVTGKNYDYRKHWFVDRLALLKQVFAVEICHYAIMDNHYHLQLTIRPDLTSNWSEDEVLERWWQLYPRKSKQTLPPEIRKLWLADPKFVAIRRQRLSNLSWFMKCLNEPIAKRANKEDGVTGSFWESRFISKRILDKEGALETGIYIDLNPVKAGLVSAIDHTTHASIEERITAVMGAGQLRLVQPIKAILSQFDHEAPYLLEYEEDYVEIVRLRARELIEKKTNALRLNRFVGTCSTAVGSAASLDREAARRKRKWLVGIRRARQLFG